MKGRSLLIHLVSRLAHRAFFLDDEEKDRAVALMRRVEAGVQASMSYCINRTVSISSDPSFPVLHSPFGLSPSLRSALTAFGGYVLIVRRFLYDVAPSAISSAELRLAYLYQ